jgi:dipeptidase E
VRLFLSSEGFGNHPKTLAALMGVNKKVAFIDNAKDAIPVNERAEHVNQKKTEFENLGFDFNEVDLRDYFNDNNKLINQLSNYGLVWLSGGNTFILRRALAYSGADKLITKLLKEDKIVYGGSSAGAIIPTPGLHGTEFGDEPHLIPEGYAEEIIWDGLNLVPFHIIPHYKSDWFGAEAMKMESYMQSNGFPYKTLMDGQVMVINSGREELLL